MNITHRFPTNMDLLDLAARLRPQDIKELQAVCDFWPNQADLSPENPAIRLAKIQAVTESVRRSDPDFLRAWFCDEELVCIAGCAPRSMLMAAPWLLGTDKLDGCLKSLHKLAGQGVREMLAIYPTLFNIVDERQLKVVNWLKALGFEIVDCPAVKPGFGVKGFLMRAG
jgi:hypothetical protein